MGSSSLFFESLTLSSVCCPLITAKRVALPYLRDRLVCTSPANIPAEITPRKGALFDSTDSIAPVLPSSSLNRSRVQTPLGPRAFSSNAPVEDTATHQVHKIRLPTEYAREPHVPPSLKRNVRVGDMPAENMPMDNMPMDNTFTDNTASGVVGATTTPPGVCGDASGGDVSGGIFSYCAENDLIRCTPNWFGVIQMVCDAYAEHGPDNSEKSYVDKVFYKLYDRGIACIRERPIFSTENGVSISRGRVDLEIASKYLLEFKIIEPSPKNLRKDSRQLMRYLRTYEEMGKPMQRAALIYLYAGEVRVVGVSIANDKKSRYSPYRRGVL
jgi:hypothetical protein